MRTGRYIAGHDGYHIAITVRSRQGLVGEKSLG